MILSDLGADVIKIEPPEGDPFRFILPDGQTWLFDLEGRGRRGIALDLRQPEAREILYKLCAQADVFVTNTPLKARKKLGISAEEICGRFPRVVYASITGYGERGPDRDVPGFDATVSRASIRAEARDEDVRPSLRGEDVNGFVSRASEMMFSCARQGLGANSNFHTARESNFDL